MIMIVYSNFHFMYHLMFNSDENSMEINSNFKFKEIQWSSDFSPAGSFDAFCEIFSSFSKHVFWCFCISLSTV